MSTIAQISDEKLTEILRGLEGVTPGPWSTMTETRYGDRSTVEEIEIWSESNDVLVATEVRRAHGDGGRATIAHIARCDPATIRSIITELQARRSTPTGAVTEALRTFAEGSIDVSGTAVIVGDARSAVDQARAALSEPAGSEQGERAIADIAAERKRQVEAEGWTPEHDDTHDKGELARAAATYALMSASLSVPYTELEKSLRNATSWVWPWDAAWWKPSGDTRRNLVKAGALIAAEIDRLDRASLQHKEAIRG